MPDPAPRPAGRLRTALVHIPFRRFLIVRFLTALAVQMQTVAIGAQLYAMTHRPLDLGLVGLSQILPFLLLVLPAGHVADRRDRRTVLALCICVQLACALALLWFTLAGITVAWPIFAIMMAFGAARAFASPAQGALMPNLVPPEALGSAIGVNSSAWQIATIAGPACGGILYSAAGPAATYGTAAALFVLALTLITRVARPAQPRAREEVTLGRLLEGLRFIVNRRVILGAASLDLFAVLLGGATALMPAYAADVLKVGPAGLGWLRAAPGIGAAFTGAWLTYRPLAGKVGFWMFGGVALYGLMTIVFGLSRSFGLSMVVLAVLGSGDMISIYVRHMLVQLETPDAMRGRVGAASAMFIGASNELGEFESGLTAAWFGLIPSVVIGGILTLAVAALWARWFPALFRMDRFPPLRGAGDL